MAGDGDRSSRSRGKHALRTRHSGELGHDDRVAPSPMFPPGCGHDLGTSVTRAHVKRQHHHLAAHVAARQRLLRITRRASLLHGPL